ncbi:c-type cytochrome [Geomonas sp.]|uniref:c-type cytochrome n=1 Tax=Geomonas sp. TaxID=2651584 RepID=UPI002B4A0200|nr:c-type cytochrome [Geomonas sp.]HJV33767.1 c-type cytochrome [Geomonas sp.]
MTSGYWKRWAAAVSFVAAVSGCGAEKGEKVTKNLLARGGKLFSVHCVGCHPAGENRIYPQKSLHAVDLRANGITTADDIVAVIRNPGRGMKKFDKSTLPDADARAIAQYILATF